jgi:hypothetical protein
MRDDGTESSADHNNPILYLPSPVAETPLGRLISASAIMSVRTYVMDRQ